MSDVKMQKASEFLDKVESDAQLGEQFSGFAAEDDRAGFRAFIEQHGADFDAVQALIVGSNDELSEGDLDQVAGGVGLSGNQQLKMRPTRDGNLRGIRLSARQGVPEVENVRALRAWIRGM